MLQGAPVPTACPRHGQGFSRAPLDTAHLHKVIPRQHESEQQVPTGRQQPHHVPQQAHRVAAAVQDVQPRHDVKGAVLCEGGVGRGGQTATGQGRVAQALQRSDTGVAGVCRRDLYLHPVPATPCRCREALHQALCHFPSTGAHIQQAQRVGHGGVAQVTQQPLHLLRRQHVHVPCAQHGVDVGRAVPQPAQRSRQDATPPTGLRALHPLPRPGVQTQRVERSTHEWAPAVSARQGDAAHWAPCSPQALTAGPGAQHIVARVQQSLLGQPDRRSGSCPHPRWILPSSSRLCCPQRLGVPWLGRLLPTSEAWRQVRNLRPVRPLKSPARARRGCP